jgi:hypothetical protein
MRLLGVIALAPLLSGCVVATVAGVAVGAMKTTAKAAGTVVETAVDAATTTQAEADEDRGRAIRLEEERQAREADRQRREAERLGTQPAPQPASEPTPPDSAGPTR